MKRSQQQAGGHHIAPRHQPRGQQLVDRTGGQRSRRSQAARSFDGSGNGPLSSFTDALRQGCGIALDIVNYDEHAIGKGSGTQAAAYIECALPDGRTVYGVGIDVDIGEASMKAVLSAANNAYPAGAS